MPALLARCRTGAPADRTASQTRRKLSIWAREKDLSASSARGKWLIRPRTRTPGIRDDGLKKVAEGATTLEEVVRVTYAE